MASKRVSRTASRTFLTAMRGPPFRVDMGRHGGWIRVGLALRPGGRFPDFLFRLGFDGRLLLVVQEPDLLQVRGKARDGVLLFPLGHFVPGAVAAVVVVAGVRPKAIGPGLYQRRAFA